MSGKLPADAFDYYVGLGAERSYQAVATKYGVTKRAVTKRAAAEEWQHHVQELESKARQAADRRTMESLEDMCSRHLKSLKVIQVKALEALRNMPLNNAMEAVRALDMGIRHERTIRGEPSDRTAVSVEDAIRKEYRRWLTEDDDEDVQDQ